MNFPKSARVRTRSEYLEFFKGSQVARLGSCLVFRIQTNQAESRLGITLKTRAGSVVRNKIKRQIRESFRLARPFDQTFDYNVVVQGRDKVDAKSVLKIRQHLDRYWLNERNI